MRGLPEEIRRLVHARDAAGRARLPGAKAHLKFPILDRPATHADVASARAIFSLEGQGEARLASMPGFPQQAKWVTLKDTPVDRTYQDGVTRREYDTDGIVWQAEEVRKGDTWERFYGFVGHHVIARAPAAEIEFAGERGLWWNLKGGLDARTEMVDKRTTGYEPGTPILVAVHIRNRLGVAAPEPNRIPPPCPRRQARAAERGQSLPLAFDGRRHEPGLSQ